MEPIRIYELYDTLWYKPFWSYSLFWWAIGLFFAVILTFITWLVLKKMKKNNEVLPWDRALQDLERLKPEYFNGYERRKEFYSEITRILKTYLSARYSIHLHDKTDYESLKDLQYVVGSSQILEKLEEIMSGAVWAKFAPDDVVNKKMVEHLSESKIIVKKTKSSQANFS